VNGTLKRQSFFSDQIYKTWYNDFSTVKTIDPLCVDNYPNGGAVPLRSGVYMVKSVISPRVYAVLPSGVLGRINNEIEATKLYGANWSSWLIDIPDSYFDTFSVQTEPLNTNTPHNGQVIRVEGRNTLYYVDDGKVYKMDGTTTVIARHTITINDSTFDLLNQVGQTITQDAIIDRQFGFNITPLSTPDTTPLTTPITINPEVPITPDPVPETVTPDNTNINDTILLSKLEQDTIDELNNYRKANNLNIVTHDDALYTLAREHSQFMQDNNIFEHVGFDERFERANRMLCVENLAWNYQSAYSVVWQGWKNSPGHNVNMLQPEITIVGMAWVGPYVTMFACK
jgi:uncharacterized protein YkwD